MMSNIELSSKYILILANTYIKNHAVDEWLLRLRERLDQANRRYDLFINNYPDNLKAYSELIIVGGDGSVNYIVNKYQQIKIPISIIPLGTGNDLYASLNHNNLDIEKSIDIAINGTPNFIDAGICNKEFFLNTFSVGFDAQVTFDSSIIAKYVPHQLKYLLAILKNILFYPANIYSINDVGRKYTQVTLMNGPRYGSGIKISPNSNLNDGKMELIMLDEIINIFTKINFLLKLKSGRHIYDKLCHISQISDNIIINCVSNTRYQIDGECRSGNHFELAVLTKFYQIKV
jgi:diacylglycerol kinase (ATP)